MKTDIVSSLGGKNRTLPSTTDAHSEAAHTWVFKASDISLGTVGYLVKTATEEDRLLGH